MIRWTETDNGIQVSDDAGTVIAEFPPVESKAWESLKVERNRTAICGYLDGLVSATNNSLRVGIAA